MLFKAFRKGIFKYILNSFEGCRFTKTIFFFFLVKVIESICNGSTAEAKDLDLGLGDHGGAP